MDDDKFDWFGYSEFYHWLAGLKGIESVVEVGSWKGLSIAYLAKSMLGLGKVPKLYCVDIWEAWVPPPEASNREQLLEDIKHSWEVFRLCITDSGVDQYITPIRDYSRNAVSRFADASVDAVFLDADHSYEAIKEDITLWLPKVRPGGIISGHDYGEEGCGVQQAVDEIFGNRFSLDKTSVWYLTV